jgi:prepilin-type N-terminal cleavage/methylation domain-containing protein
MKRRGLTLIEVIVCMAIIMILGGICYAAMGPVRESARQRMCVSNLRQLGAAFRMYMDDYSGVEPSIGTASTPSELGLPTDVDYLVDNYAHNRSIIRCPNYQPRRGLDPEFSYWGNGHEDVTMPLPFSQLVKKRGGELPIMGCEFHHPDYDLSIEPRWTLAKVIFLRLNGSVESRMKSVREYPTTW